MAYGYPSQMASGTFRIFKRPMSDRDRLTIAKYYRFQQNILRSIAIIPLVLFFLVTFLLSGTGVLMILSYLFMAVLVLLAAVILGMSYYLFQFRKKMSAVLRDGMAVEVLGTASGSRTKNNNQSYKIGPVSLTALPKALEMIQDGAMTSVICIPKLKVVVSANNVALENGAGMTCPSNLDEIAENVPPAGQPYVAPPQAVYPQYTQPSPQMQFQPPNYPPYPPPRT